MTWGERHVPTNASRLLVALLDTSSGDGAGRVIASQVLANPGMQPVVFSLTYARADLAPGDHYRVVAALLDGDLAWLNRDGVDVPVPEPAISGVVVPLSFKPDLLKAQVSGIVTGDGLDGAAAATSYASVVLLNETTGEILGYDAVSPIGAAPIAFSIPYSLADIDQGGNYIVSATAWDGTRLWTQTQFARVITKGNPSVGVTVPLGPGPAPSPRPTDAPIIVDPSFPPAPDLNGDPGIGFFGFILLLAAVTAGTALLSWSVMEFRARARRKR